LIDKIEEIILVEESNYGFIKIFIIIAIFIGISYILVKIFEQYFTNKPNENPIKTEVAKNVFFLITKKSLRNQIKIM